MIKGKCKLREHIDKLSFELDGIGMEFSYLAKKIYEYTIIDNRAMVVFKAGFAMSFSLHEFYSIFRLCW